jgi:hypothetical protein
MTSVANPNRRTSEHKRCVNELIHERSALENVREAEPVAFVCECSSPACFQTVWLAASDYETSRLDDEWVVLGARHQ